MQRIPLIVTTHTFSLPQIRVLSSKDLSPCTQGVIEDHHCMVTALYTDHEHIVSGGKFYMCMLVLV